MTAIQTFKQSDSENDSHLSDYEWKSKMAADGKAYYVPGKTADEMKAATENRLNLSRRLVEMTDEEWSGLDTAIPDIIEIMDDVRNIFFDFSYAADLDRPAINSIMRLAARAVQSMQDNEVKVLDRLDLAMRASRKESPL